MSAVIGKDFFETERGKQLSREFSILCKEIFKEEYSKEPDDYEEPGTEGASSEIYL